MGYFWLLFPQVGLISDQLAGTSCNVQKNAHQLQHDFIAPATVTVVPLQYH